MAVGCAGIMSEVVGLVESIVYVKLRPMYVDIGVALNLRGKLQWAPTAVTLDMSAVRSFGIGECFE